MLGQILIGIVSTAAVAAWLVAAVTGVQIAGRMPRGQRLSGFYDLGWWRFDKIENAAGPGVVPLTRRYRWAFAGFFVALLCMLLVSALSGAFRDSGATPLVSAASLAMPFPAAIRQET